MRTHQMQDIIINAPSMSAEQRAAKRKEIQEGVDAFLAAGGEIKQIPRGVMATKDDTKVTRHFII